MNFAEWWTAWFDWGVSQGVTGALQWIGTLISVVGIPVAAWKAWTAATAAEKAELAVHDFNKRLSLANVAHTSSQVELVRNLITSGDFKAAMTVVAILKRTVLQIARNLQAGQNPPASTPQGPKNVRTIEHQLAKAIRADVKFNPSVLDAAIQGLGEVLLDWEGLYFDQHPGV